VVSLPFIFSFFFRTFTFYIFLFLHYLFREKRRPKKKGKKKKIYTQRGEWGKQTREMKEKENKKRKINKTEKKKRKKRPNSDPTHRTYELSHTLTTDKLTNPGRADTLQETPFQTARREASEEIGLPEDEGEPSILPPFRVEHLCELPANLAKTELVVRPCVALLHGYDPVTGLEADPEVSLIPKLDAREVAAVFTAPFRDFLSITEDVEWYRGSWSLWHDSRWRSKFNLYPIPRIPVAKCGDDVFFFLVISSNCSLCQADCGSNATSAPVLCPQSNG
jgi:8-oxo-dGTP pyrophosphatase MutT (NUDIX family)